MKRYTIEARLNGVKLIEKKKGELVKYAEFQGFLHQHDGLVCEISELKHKLVNLEGLWVDECANVTLKDNKIDKLKFNQINFLESIQYYTSHLHPVSDMIKKCIDKLKRSDEDEFECSSCKRDDGK